ncbi:hypothetical protein [Chamaesiphon sp. VAR_48_metabat_135_sub]|uniref:hypothetical protein n=1 Tax=Chamaesiphon sp. VAR_48_metabat_135_sub TaxID=2964699 RepID=UPI00286D32E5|nr:hypothetical protein [Chamaesiphon sp. VAR_48_metabat_135_sub]
MKNKIYISVISLLFTIGIFLPIVPVLANPYTSSTQVKPGTVHLTGTIHKLVVEGTCYQLATDNGDKYELMGKFPKIDGTRVRVSGVVAVDTVTICQVGKPLKVKSVRVIK